MKLRDLLVITFAAVILFVADELLHSIPNVQLSVFFLVLFSRKLKTARTALVIVIYVLLDALYMTAVNPVYMTFMILGWMMTPVLMNTLFARTESELVLALGSILCALAYCWMFAIPNVLIYRMDFVKYMLADLPFEAILCASSFLSVLWLYRPCSKAWDSLRGHMI